MKAVAAATADQYAAVFHVERQQQYPVVDDFERRFGYAIDRPRLEEAARILACPIKAHPPNWQHGRVLYAIARSYLATHPEPITMLDVGTAKGFSALCLGWALRDAGRAGTVTSVDVIDPASRERRNTVSEVDGYKTLRQILEPWPESAGITFEQSSGHDWLALHPGRIHLAFVDGKHSYVAVRIEAALLAERQQLGDLAIFDDIQIPGVAEAIGDVKGYTFEELRISGTPPRGYAIGWRL